MSERQSSSYPILFQTRILHHYWLDYGSTLFDDLPKDALEKSTLQLPDATPTQEQHLQAYDVRRFFTIAPTAATSSLLAGLGCVFKTSALGFLVAAKQSVVFSKQLQFEFTLTVNQADFINYTALTLRPQLISEVYQAEVNKIQRYKSQVPVLSNLTGAIRGNGAAQALYLAREVPPLAADDTVEALVQINNALVQLTSDQPGAGQQQVSAQVSAAPVFVHQGDVNTDGLALAGLPDDLFALIRITAARPDNDAFSFIDPAGAAKAVAPVFQIRFRNRATQWLYYRQNTGKSEPPFFVEPSVLPLTFFGNASSANPKKSKPLPASIGVKFDNSVKPKVLGLSSEIFA